MTIWDGSVITGSRDLSRSRRNNACVREDGRIDASIPSGVIMRIDLYTKVVLTTIALLLGVLALRPVVSPVSVQAQSDAPSLYIEPEIIPIQNPNSTPLGTPGEGKMVIDLRTGDVWGFPRIVTTGPIDINKPPMSKPAYLGRFDFSAMKGVP